MNISVLLTVGLVIASCSLADALRPIIYISGLYGNAIEFGWVESLILSEYPEADISTVSVFYESRSLINLWTQIEVTYNLIQPKLESSPDGVTFICFSQGRFMTVHVHVCVCVCVCVCM